MNVIKINSELTEVKTVAHIADIHIRPFKRHKEFKLVFDKLYKSLREKKPDVILLAGDIVHAKTEMSPELIYLTSDLFKKLSKIAVTIIIPGNHDCFTYDHEVLTKSGWVKIGDYVNNNIIDDVYCFDINDNELKLQTPIAKIKKKFSGNLKNIIGNDVDLLVTPTHNILYQHSQYDKFYKKTAENIPKSALIPINGIINNFTNNYFFNLLGFAFADGSFILKNKNTMSSRIQFKFKKIRKKEYLLKILNELKYKYNLKFKNDIFYLNIYSDLAKDVYLYFNGKKEIPKSLLSENKNNIKSFLDGYLNGDGCNVKNDFFSFCNISENSINILETCFRLVGGTSHFNRKNIQYGNFKNSKRQYTCTVNTNNIVNRTTIKQIKDIEYNGDVYCLTVPSSNLLIRRNNKIFITGNCNLNNRNRLDALSPIVNNINCKNLHYLKNSGVYEIGDACFSHMSLLDEELTYIDANDINNNNNKIALYHGIVNNAQNDFGFKLKNGILTTTFKNYDMVMLGDIHKMQILQEYSVEEKTIDKEDLQKYLDNDWEIKK